MNRNILKYLVLFLVVFFFGTLNSHADGDYLEYEPKIEEEFDSMEKWENWYVYTKRQKNSHSCTGKIIWDVSELDNTYIPTALGQNAETSKGGSHTNRTINYVATGILGYATGGVGLLLIGGIQYSIMTDVCASAYVLAPHEYVNRELMGYTCDGGLKERKDISWNAGNGNVAFNKTDIPFYFHCDPKYDPVGDRTINEDSEDAKLIGRTMGYAGAASSYCNDQRLTPHLGKLKDLTNTITVEYKGWFERPLTESGWNACEESGPTKPLKPGDTEGLGPTNVQAYYRLSPAGKVQICAAAPDLFFPIRIGCHATAAPGDETNIDDYLRNYVSDTRCEYLIFPRTDLQSLGKGLPGAGSANPVKKFLQSDMHLTSTVVGCIKDMLAKIFIKTPNDRSRSTKPFFQTFQERMTQIVMAAMVLYVALVGIKIMTAGQPPQRHEAIMYVLKFAIVMYFALGSGFYEVENGEIVGLYPNLIQVPDELSDIFLQAQNINDPGGYCFYNYKGSNILSERTLNRGEIQGGIGTAGTKGDQYIKMTVWDLVDCKIINYLTLGSCDYSLGGMMSVWFGSASLFVDKIGIVLAVVSILYTIMILLTMFKFTHIFILSMFTITILIFLAPIFMVFWLFDPLKEIFNAWLRMILGYLIYPAMLFAFAALMFATFDSIFYGDLNLNDARSGTGGAIDYEKACAGVDSVYCKTQKAVGYRDNCAGGSISQLLLTKDDSELFGSVTKLSDSIAEDFRDVMLKMLLFAFLFYLFLNSITDFFSSMLRVGGMEQISGLQAVGGPIGQGVGKFAGAAAKKAPSAATGLAGRAVGGAAGSVGRGVNKLRGK